MIVMPFMELASTPSIGSIIGTQTPTALLNTIAQKWGNNLIKFGTREDPFKERHLSFLNNIVQTAQQATNIFRKAVQPFIHGNRVPIPVLTKPEQLTHIPCVLWEPILTMPEVRHFHKKDEIYGFGIKPDEIPEEDATGRLINNGRTTIEIGTDPVLHYEWHSSDPNYTEAELNALEQSRTFIREYLYEQLTSGSHVDPTGYPSGRIGKLQ